MSIKVLICVPTYNESENIIEILLRLNDAINIINLQPENYAFTILVVDDNSPDGTANLVASKNIPNVEIMRRAMKTGLGPAYLAAFAWGIERDFDIFIECDADGSHQPEELPAMMAALSGSDLVIGTRWMPGGRVLNWPLHRRLVSRIGTKYAQVVLRLPYRDLTGGFRVLIRHSLETINFESIESLGYGFQIEIAMRAHDAGLAIAQVPITFIERTHGASKMSRRIVLEALTKTTKWAFRRITIAR